MKPFDLEKAKSGHPLITRDGRKAKFITHVPECREYEQVIVKCEGRDICTGYNIYGCFMLTTCGHPNDLFLAAEKKTGWVNIYPAELFKNIKAADLSFAYTTEDLANINANPNRLACVEISWEE